MNNILKFEGQGCYGCGVCAVACPKKIIDIRLNADGFFEPFIDRLDDCIDCGLCLKVCSYNSDEVATPPTVQSGYAVFSKDQDTRLHSTSGGFAFELSKKLLTEGYDLCGVKYDYEAHRARHFVARTFDEMKLAQGSKYLQSYLPEALAEVVKDRTRQHIVVGTPCQIDSVRRLLKLRKLEDRFLLIDFYCHGVPSYLMWEKYLSRAAGKVGEIQTIRWRNKVNGWQNSTTMYVAGEKGSFYSAHSQGDPFFKFFLGNRCLGKACYDHCKFKQCTSSDIRMGDFWGKTFAHSAEGVSAIRLNTPKGQTAFDAVKSQITCEEVGPQVVGEGQIKQAASRSDSYNCVHGLLKKPYSLDFIGRVADVLEFPAHFVSTTQYYFHRIPTKLMQLCGLKR